MLRSLSYIWLIEKRAVWDGLREVLQGARRRLFDGPSFLVMVHRLAVDTICITPVITGADALLIFTSTWLWDLSKLIQVLCLKGSIGAKSVISSFIFHMGAASNGLCLVVSVGRLLQGKRWSVVEDWLAIGYICLGSCRSCRKLAGRVRPLLW